MRNIIGCILILTMLMGCSKHKDTIKIGLAVNLTGPASEETGVHIRDGALMAVDEINREGGINGKPIELIIKDDKMDPAYIRETDSFFIAKHVVCIIGHSTSYSTMIGYNYLKERNSDILLISPYCATTSLSGIDDNFFRTNVDNTANGRAMAKLIGIYGWKNIVYIIDTLNKDFSVSYANEIDKNLNDCKTFPVEIDSRDKGYLLKIRKYCENIKPDVLILLTPVKATAKIVEYLKRNKCKCKCKCDYVATIWAQADDIGKFGGEYVEGLKLVSFIAPCPSPLCMELDKKMNSIFKHGINSRSIRAYEVIGIISEALKHSKNISSSSLKESLLKGTFIGVNGDTIKFDKYGEVKRPIYELEMRGGEWRIVRKLDI